MRTFAALAMAGLTATAAHAQLRYWVSVQVEDGPNELRLYRGDQLQFTMEQFGGAADDPVGFLDGTSDGGHIYFGWSGGIVQYNQDGTDPTVIIDGPPPLLTTWRALHFDGSGDDHHGSFWTADGVSALVEVDLSGEVLRALPNPGLSIVGIGSIRSDGLELIAADGTLKRVDRDTGLVVSEEPPMRSGITRWSGLDYVPSYYGGVAAIGDNLLISNSEYPPVGPWPLLGDRAVGQGVAVVHEECGVYICGDTNCDGAFDGADIDAFFFLLGDPQSRCEFVPCPCVEWCVGDTNSDGLVDGADIDSFFEGLMLGHCP